MYVPGSRKILAENDRVIDTRYGPGLCMLRFYPYSHIHSLYPLPSFSPDSPMIPPTQYWAEREKSCNTYRIQNTGGI